MSPIDKQIALATVNNATIMMVDDEQLNMDVLRLHLESEGYTRFECVSDARNAITEIRRIMPAVLLLDIVMPHVSGFDILQEMRNDPELYRIPVIVLTSADNPNTKLSALQLGATDFLAKPVDSSELALRLRNSLTARAYHQRLTLFDTLTQLPNRTHFMRLLQCAVDVAVEDEKSSALVLINISRFKAVNDSLGPDRGDAILEQFSERLQTSFCVDSVGSELFVTGLGDGNRVARMGGDRFAALIPLRADDVERHALNEAIDAFSTAIESPFHAQGEHIYLDISIGVAVINSRTESVKLLVNEAETAMLHAKRRHDTNCVFYSKNLDARARDLLIMENGLRTAVDKGEMFLAFQPKVNVETGRIVGAEALARWRHPEFGLISPVDFIPLAENSGMIVSIGEWVMRESCQQAVAWQQLGYKRFRIAVNVSVRQMHEPDFMTMVKRALDETGLSPDSLVIELTENLIMENAEANIVKLNRLKSLGIDLSIDDFGTGYSSLSYLQRFPIDQLKIDRSFITEIKQPDDKSPIVKAVVSLAHDLGMVVVAEGIETEAQLAHMRACKCEEYQGYLCSKPVDAETFLNLLEAQQQKAA